jgi:hypothetical protein
MFFEVLSPIYHSPITIESLTYRVLLGTLAYSASVPALLTKEVESLRPNVYKILRSLAKASQAPMSEFQSFR